MHGGEETDLPSRRIQNNVCTYYPLQEVEFNSPPLKAG